ncbi:MAG TPA: heavy metal-responsive transcriptional regulator [Anaerolineae bacterium]
MNEYSASKQLDYGIGELARATGVSTKAIRYYEEAGLLPAARRAENGYRLYNELDIERLHFIRSARALGFPINDLTEIVAMRERGQRPCRQVIEQLVHKAAEVSEHIQRLQSLRAELNQMLAIANELPLDPADADECVCDVIGKSPLNVV